jgi:hypothetical protein
MAINSLSKTSIGVSLSLLLVILLSESRLFKFFTDTYLGRAFLIFVLLFASYLNKILGVVCVFIIIVMFNSNNIFSSYYEGFDSNNTSNGSDTKNAGGMKKDNKNTEVTITDSISTTTTGNNTPVTTHTPVPDDKINVVDSQPDSSKDSKNNGGNSSNKAIEGFDLQSTENNIRRGKQSNSIPINQYNKQSIEVAPYESANFSNFFGLL